MSPLRTLAVTAVLLVTVSASTAAAQTDFITFESGPVQPIVLSPNETRLFVANTPDGHLEVYDLSFDLPVKEASIPVGLEPVALLALSEDIVWVVNHLSDSVSIVDVSQGRVIRTLLVGDEPRGIVVADPPGITGPRVFIATAHRGQHRIHGSISGVPGAGDPELTTEGVDRADVWVFDPDALGTTLGGTPLEILSFFADSPRALAASTDGSTVYVAAFNSGNQSAVVPEPVVCDGFAGANNCNGDGIVSPGGLNAGKLPGGNPGPSDNHASSGAPEVGLIVQWDPDAGPTDSDPTTGEFQDEDSRNWNNGIRFSLPDKDVFAIDVASLTEVAHHASVGTTLFNMVVNPSNGNLYVSNTEAINLTRFEGSGAHAGSTVRGHLAEARITVIETPNSHVSTGSNVKPRHLNNHIPYATYPVPAGIADDSLAIPTQMAIHDDGQGNPTLYVAAFGSSKVGVFDTNSIDTNSFTPDSANHINVTGGGVGGLALSADGHTLYVHTRFDNSFSTINTNLKLEVAHNELHNPEPTQVVEGRSFLYDAVATSSNGEASCAACHIFGDMDQLAWDLGDPDGDVTSSPLNNLTATLVALAEGQGLINTAPINGDADLDEFHPMKGPMTTQTLRGLVNAGAQHWRGDRSNGFFGSNATDSDLSFRNFIVAFTGLLGRNSTISGTDMQKFTDFAMELTLPPNPIRALDNSLTADEQIGFDFFTGTRRSDGITGQFGGNQLGFVCNECHVTDPAQGFFGTAGDATFENETQIMKVPHLRNLYQKVGMFGMPETDFELPGDNAFKGDQIRGFGYLHDGSTDTLFRFFRATVFSAGFFGDNNVGFETDAQRRGMEAFMLAFDSDLAPIVGQQVTLENGSPVDVSNRIDLMIVRADTSFDSEILGVSNTECDLVAKGSIGGEQRGWLYVGGGVGTGNFVYDDGSTLITDTNLRALVSSEGPITFTCVPPGSGIRAGINRDRDNFGDYPDNCPDVPNNSQTDTNMNGIGDDCEVVPEPSAIALLAAGVAGLAGLQGLRRRRDAGRH